jgi:uncharacterized membrane protein (DUF485 family)
MNTQKAAYLDKIRSQTLYFGARRTAVYVAIFFNVLGAICIIGGLFMIPETSGISVLWGLLSGVLNFAIGAVIKETSIMVADIADSITDLNSRYETTE